MMNALDNSVGYYKHIPTILSTMLGNNLANKSFKKSRNYPKFPQMLSEHRGCLILLFQKVVKSFEEDKNCKFSILSLLRMPFRTPASASDQRNILNNNDQQCFRFHRVALRRSRLWAGKVRFWQTGVVCLRIAARRLIKSG